MHGFLLSTSTEHTGAPLSTVAYIYYRKLLCSTVERQEVTWLYQHGNILNLICNTSLCYYLCVLFMVLYFNQTINNKTYVSLCKVLIHLNFVNISQVQLQMTCRKCTQLLYCCKLKMSNLVIHLSTTYVIILLPT